MALSRTSLLGANSGASGNYGAAAFETSSFTPPDNSLLVVSVSLIENGGSNPPLADLTIAGGGLTFTARASDSADTAFATSTVIYTAPVTTGASMTLTLDCGSRMVGVYSVSVVAYTGHNSSSPTGATATGHQVGGFGGPPTPASITLSGNPAATSEVVAAVGTDRAPNPGTEPGTGWTELHDLHNTSWGGLQTECRTGSTSSSVAWADLRSGGGALFNFAAAAVEIVVATGSTVNAAAASTVTATVTATAAVTRAATAALTVTAVRSVASGVPAEPGRMASRSATAGLSSHAASAAMATTVEP